jgi:quercetin dioxygenase-like cupin family protein
MDYGSAIVVDGLASLELRPSRSVIYDREIELRSLYEDPESGAEHYIIRYPAGVRTKRHRHTASHTIIVLTGRLEVNGRVVGPGSYSHFPAGQAMGHQPVDGPCLFVIMFDGPVDVQVVEA